MDGAGDSVTSVPLPFGSIDNRRSLLSVWNLCDLILALANIPVLTSGVVMVSDGHDLSTSELIRRLSVGMNRSARLISMPESMLRLAGAVTGKSAEVARLCGSLRVDMDATRRQVGWVPSVSVDEGLARTARWYVEEVVGRAG